MRITAYPVEAKGGLLWAYLGPQPAPLVPNCEPFIWKNGFVQIVFSKVPCNWLQCQENSIDPVHFEWMHRNWIVAAAQARRDRTARKHLKIDFDEFDYGFTYHRLIEGMPDDNERWTVGRVVPVAERALGRTSHFEWRVPIDDENTLERDVALHAACRANASPTCRASIPSWEGPVTDPLTGRWVTSHVMNQDFVAWVGQGTIADRTQGASRRERPRRSS